MGEILQIQVGQCGTRVGNKFWRTISDEHGIDEQGQFAGYSARTQLERINVFYQETKSEEYVPRAVLVDTDPTTLHSLVGHANCRFRRENFLCIGDEPLSNWDGQCRVANKSFDRVWDAIRSEVERCDRLQGFQIVHSLGGGTGSGLGACVAEYLRAGYPSRTVNTFSTVWPRPCDTATVFGGDGEPLNTALCAARLIGAAHNTYLSDNRTLYDTCTGPMAIAVPTYADLNHLVSLTMSGITAGLRFAGQPNADMAKRTNDLVPYRRLHFFATAFAPPTHRGQLEDDVCARTDAAAPLRLAAQLFAAVRSRCRDRLHVVIAAATTFRGGHLRCCGQPDVWSRRLVAAAVDHQQRFLFPNNVKSTMCAVPSCGIPLSGTLVANTTAVRDLFDRVRRRCVYALTKRDRLHSHVAEGMTSDDFYHALEKIDSLIEEYRSIEEMVDDNDRSVGV